MLLTKSIFQSLVNDQEYFQKVWPHLTKEYFELHEDAVIFKLFKTYIDKHAKPPSKNALLVMLEGMDGLSEHCFKAAYKKLKSMDSEVENTQFMIDTTEEFCKDQAVHLALAESLMIKDNSTKPEKERNKKLLDVGAIPKILQDALTVSFHTDVGHDWNDDADARYDMYKEKADKIPFMTKTFNDITKDGVERGTLNIILGGVNVGKSMNMCSLSCEYMQQGYNVLYISMEMNEKSVMKRIDANLLDVSLDDFDMLTKVEFNKRMERVNSKYKLGKMKAKQFPTSIGNVNHFRALLEELKLKKGFVPDVVMIDYLGICASSRIKMSENSYTLVKAVAEEVRGLAIEYNFACWSGAQLNREGFKSSDPDMSDTAESFGLPATADLMLVVVETEEGIAAGEHLFKQVKSRYASKTKKTRFHLMVDTGKQRYYEASTEVDIEAQSEAAKQIKATNDKPSSRRSKLKQLDEQEEVTW